MFPSSIRLVCLLYIVSLVKAYNSKSKTYFIDLNAEPEIRWNKVVKDHLPYLPQINEEIRQYFKFPYSSLLCWLLDKLSGLFPEEYSREMLGIANASGIEYCHIVGLNILYDITNYNDLISGGLGCTSIVVENDKGQIYHGRNLDYMMTDLMKNLSIIVHFEKNNKTIYSALTYAFFAGVSTGQRPKAFTLSLNARRTGRYIFTLMMQIYTSFHLPIGFALRQTLQHSSSYSDALNYLSNIHFVAPSYLILAGTTSGEGALITRDRWSAAEVVQLDSAKGHWYIVQTNYDRWNVDEDKRRTIAENLIEEMGQKDFDQFAMLDVLQSNPISNIFTITTTVMSATNPHLLPLFTMIGDEALEKL